jgi:beta-galactosidase/beta-glucuronidase
MTEQIDLVAQGIDTVGHIWLNGALVAHVENMFRRYEFDVSKLLKVRVV